MHLECLSPPCKKVLNKLKTLVKSEGFVLAGGTALALYLGHRISMDLDFFSEHPFSTDTLMSKIQKAGLTPEVLQESQGTLNLLVNRVKVSVHHYPYPFSENTREWNGILISGLTDIAAMKVIAISQRGAKRDFADLYFLLQDLPFRKVAEQMIQKYGKNRINPVSIGKALVYFRDAEPDPDPQYCGREKPDWETIKRFFHGNLKQMVYDLHAAAKPIHGAPETLQR